MREREQHSAERPASLLGAIQDGGADADGGPPILDGAAEPADQLAEAYERSFEEAIAGSGSIYEPMSPILLASHERRMALLDALPVGDLSNKVCVDYGVGSWGFGIIYTRLQRCGLAIGIDISRNAIAESTRKSAEGEWPYGANYRYLTSRGDDLKLPSGSVDLFFAGESIEHVENTEAFLDEVHRVLKPGGTFVFTTPNADAYFYRLEGERYCIGPEHVALMGWDELCDYLTPTFDIVVAKGFNGSLHSSWDPKLADADVARAWAAQFADRPDLATGVVVMARRRDDYEPGGRLVEKRQHHEAPAIRYEGTWRVVPLHRSMTGRNGFDGDASLLSLDFDGTDLLVFLWSHSWGGNAFVEVDGRTEHVDLYSPLPGFLRLHFRDLAPGRHCLRVRGSQARNPRSESNQVIFYQAISYQRAAAALFHSPTRPPADRGGPRRPVSRDQEEHVASMDQGATGAQHMPGIRPGRIGVIYTAPTRLTGAERLLLYGLVLGIRPTRCLVLGTGEGGTTLIVGAALDDVGTGRLVSVDRRSAMAPECWRQVSHRAALVTGELPGVLDRAADAAAGPFDFVFLEPATEPTVLTRTLEGALALAAPDAHLLVYDAHQPAVAATLSELLWQHADRLLDCGMLAVEQTRATAPKSEAPLVGGGLRLLRLHRAGD